MFEVLTEVRRQLIEFEQSGTSSRFTGSHGRDPWKLVRACCEFVPGKQFALLQPHQTLPEGGVFGLDLLFCAIDGLHVWHPLLIWQTLPLTSSRFLFISSSYCTITRQPAHKDFRSYIDQALHAAIRSFQIENAESTKNR